MVATPPTTTKIMPGRKKNAIFGIGMSPAWAEIISTWANWTLIGALIVGVVATYGIVVSGKAKEAALKRDLAVAGAEAAKANERSAILEKQTQELRAANLALEARVRARRLTGEDSRKLTVALSKIQPLPIGIVSPLLDIEGSDFADDIFKAFTEAHWQAVRQKDWTMPNKGVAIATLEGTILPSELAEALRTALATANINTEITTIPKNHRQTTSAHFQPNALYLLVGAKPQ